MVTPFSLFSLCWVHATLVQRDYLLANSTGKAAWMVSLSQSCHYFTFHEVPTTVAAGPIHALVIQGAEIFPILNEKASLCQVTATHWKRKNPHSNRLEKIHLTKDVSNSLLPTDETTLVVLLTSTTFLLSPPVTTCFGIPGKGWYSLATREPVIKTFLGGIYIITTFRCLVLAKTSVTFSHPVNHVISYLYQYNLAFTSGPGGRQKISDSINRTDFTILYTSIHFFLQACALF